ncbi:MAG: thioredoxin family protein [Ginsengibacter sp.]
MRFILTFAFVVITVLTMAQRPYEIIDDSNHPESKILKGLISKDILKSDTAYKWYSENQKIYAHPDTAIVNAFKRNKDSVSYIIFGGTWCEDTQFILPKFFILQEKAGVSNEHITLYAVDRQKQTSGNLSLAFNIKNVPTIIIMKYGKELARVVEYGKSGKWDKELADFLN